MKLTAMILFCLCLKAAPAPFVTPSFDFCESVPAPVFIFVCDAATPQEYRLFVQAGNSQTTAYGYTVTATLPDGSSKTLSGLVARTDLPGNAEFAFTTVRLAFGNAASEFKIQIQELAVVAVQ